MVKKRNPVDLQVGERVRGARLLLRMSQTDLGNAVGVTFQQVQKYEKGANRIGASRLSQIAAELKQPVSYFFDGVTGANGAPNPDNPITKLAMERVGVDLARAFIGLPSVIQRQIVTMVETLREHVR